MANDMLSLKTDIKNTLSYLRDNRAFSTVNATEQLINRKGEIDALSDLMKSGKKQGGFKKLEDLGRLDDLSFESLVIRYASLFDKDVVELAQWRLDNYDQLPS